MHRSIDSKIKSSDDLEKLLKEKPEFVFTNGCFDILHSGHVQYLEQAKAQGDLLIVAVNSDASVKQLKGPTRPINALQDRLKVVAALESVDYVTWFEEQTPLTIIEKIKPSLIVKGGDWDMEKLPETKLVAKWGGRALSLPFVEGKSTTKIIESSKNAT